jgi:hypothetical protein
MRAAGISEEQKALMDDINEITAPAPTPAPTPAPVTQPEIVKPTVKPVVKTK